MYNVLANIHYIFQLFPGGRGGGGGGGPMNRCVCQRLGVRGIISETVGHQISGRHISGRFSLRPVLFGNIYVVCVIIYPEFRIPDPDGLPLLQNFLSQ